MNGKAALILVLVLITFTEYIYVYSNVAYGILLSLLLTVGIFIAVSLVKEEGAVTRSAEALALVPLYVLFTSSLPWFFIKQVYLVPAVYSVILLLCFWHIYELEIPLEAVGLVQKFARKEIAIGILLAIPLGTLEYLILRPTPAAPEFLLSVFFRDLTYMTLFVGIGEELLFRGIIQTELQKVFSPKVGLFLASALFGVMHLTWRSVPELFFTFLAGLILGYLYNKTGNLTAPIVLHGVNNTVLISIWPYLMG
jgi:uncharacterized protein